MRSARTKLEKAIPRKITSQWLWDIDACEGVIERFQELYPRGGEPSLDMLKAIATTAVELAHLVGKILSEAGCADYKKAHNAAVKRYNNVVAEIPSPTGLRGEDLAAWAANYNQRERAARRRL